MGKITSLLVLFGDQIIHKPTLILAILFGFFGLHVIKHSAKMAHHYKWKNKLSKENYLFTRDLLRMYPLIMVFVLSFSFLLKDALDKL